jgi:hypothetical protein
MEKGTEKQRERNKENQNIKDHWPDVSSLVSKIRSNLEFHSTTSAVLCIMCWATRAIILFYVSSDV